MTQRIFVAIVALLLCGALPARAQTGGTILGRVHDADDGRPLAGASVRVLDTPLRTAVAEDGRFVLVAVPVGARRLRVELIGYRPVTLDGVLVRAGVPAEVRIELVAAPIEMEGIVVTPDRVRLIEPEVTSTHELVLGRELRDLPIDAVTDALDLVSGVSGGHFRGGRTGHEVYLIDGVEVKNAVESSTRGWGLQVSPGAIEEVDVVTGGFRAEYGSTLSGVVSVATRRGRSDRWGGQAGLRSDHVVPGGAFHGYTALSLNGGGPVTALGRDAVVFGDVWLEDAQDADPRARGLTCLRPEDAGIQLRPLLADLAARGLLCPYTRAGLPHQRGEKALAFARFDRSVGGASVTASLLANRDQRQLYIPELKYHPVHRLGQRSSGALASLAATWTRHAPELALRFTARGSVMRLDRYLGALDPASVDEADAVGGFGLRPYRFLGESFVRGPVDRQIDGAAVPGYEAPGYAGASPFGPGADGLFYTEGTPGLANWTRQELVGLEARGEAVATDGKALHVGSSVRLHRVQAYERAHAYLPEAPHYLRFHPANAAAFAEASLGSPDDANLQFGVRLEAFRSGLSGLPDTLGALLPAGGGWKLAIMPRVGVAAPLPIADGRTAVRMNMALLSQPPDFRYFLDSFIDDSLRTDLRRQGSPDLSFEHGVIYEVALSQLIGENAGVTVTAFRKDLKALVATSVAGESGDPRFALSDYGRVQGVELSLRGRGSGVGLRAAYALQSAYGVVAGPFDIVSGEAARIEYPLAFDRRHAASLALLFGRAAGYDGPWSAALTAHAGSGYPVQRIGDASLREDPDRLPWSIATSARVARDIAAIPRCAGCRLRVVADGRNLLGRETLLGARRDTGTLAPGLAAVEALAAAPPLAAPIPRESPRYSEAADLNGDGQIDAAEFRTLRLAAAVDRFDPSLYFAAPRQLRVGLEVTF